MSKEKRIAIIDENKCKPEKCKRECIKSCPPQTSGHKVIDIEDISTKPLVSNSRHLTTDKKQIARIVEELCIGCNICVSRCPFSAIKIVKLPKEIPEECLHRYSENGFKLYKLPILKPNKVIGIIGENGIGKSTLINVLSGKIIPNFGEFRRGSEGALNRTSTKEVINKFKGTQSQTYFRKLFNNQLTISVKPQKIYKAPIQIEPDMMNNELFTSMNMEGIIHKDIATLSGGELQKLLCWITASKEADVYIFDEPSNFLDVKQRVDISKVISSLAAIDKYVIVIEHDLSLLDYISDEVYICYGNPGAFGIVSNQLTSSEGINHYLAGYIAPQNIRFRETEYDFSRQPNAIPSGNRDQKPGLFQYPATQINYGDFILNVPAGEIDSCSLNVILGENGTGKTTFVNYLSSVLNELVSVKNQHALREENDLTVREILHGRITPTFYSEVVKPLDIDNIKDRKMSELSGGELQLVMIVLCFLKPAMIYLLDEPSANLDIEKRLKITHVIKTFITNNNKCCFIIEHDMMMCVSLAQHHNSNMLFIQKVVQEQGIYQNTISEPLKFDVGINEFLKSLDVTMRVSNRPRINKRGSRLDSRQKANNKYYD